jgi:hypothetical protein
MPPDSQTEARSIALFFFWSRKMLQNPCAHPSPVGRAAQISVGPEFFSSRLGFPVLAELPS